MKIAIYARYSTDSQDVTSIAGQVANCEALAGANGWTVAERYSDAAISGTDDSRPDYQRLLADYEALRFDGIIVDETSRLTRRPGELPRLLELLAFRNQFLVDCKGFDSRQETAGLLASIYGGIDSLELRKIKERTHRGLRERHRGGFSAGGKTYGYDTVPADADDPDSKKCLVIVDEQAAIVVEIFERYAAGESPRAICDDLNRRKVPSPGSTWKRTKRRTRGWTQSAIVGTASQFTGILRREMYVGRRVWNRRRSKKVPGTSKRVFEIRPESEWEITTHPELRIIDDLLWQKVQARLRAARDGAHPNNLRPRGRPSRYLLSGLMRCGECGGHYVVQDTRAYGCSSRINGGKHLCGNSLRVKRQVAETVLLAKVKESLLGDDVIAYVRAQFEVALRTVEAGLDPDKLRRRIADLDDKLARVADAIETVGINATLTERLRTLQAEKQQAEDELVAATAARPQLDIRALVPECVARWRQLVENIEDLAKHPEATTQDIETARNHLHALLGPIVLRPQNGVLWAHPTAKAKGLVEARPLPKIVVAGAGFEPATFGL